MIRSTNTGVATKIDEYVPTIIPISKANEKPLREGPPNRNKTKTTTKVVNDVMSVLLIVLFIDSFTTGITSLPALIPKFSLTLSKTTTVSLIEYPIIVNKAAINT